jgi:hypothetical protein
MRTRVPIPQETKINISTVVAFPNSRSRVVDGCPGSLTLISHLYVLVGSVAPSVLIIVGCGRREQKYSILFQNLCLNLCRKIDIKHKPRLVFNGT